MADQEEGATTIKVVVRCRPFNTREKNANESCCVKITNEQLVITNPNDEKDEHIFGFDHMFDWNSNQNEVWDAVGLPTLNKAFGGYNGTIFAYGQTGSGKTWTMQGAENEELQGIIPRMNRNLFDRIQEEKTAHPSLEFLVTVSYFEIYNEFLFDLLDATDRRKKKDVHNGLEIKEHPVLGVYVKGLQELVVDNPTKLQSLIDQGMGNRTVASTQMNADSSRSHSVFTIKIHQKDLEDESRNVFAKINLVDLAGSERVKSTGASGATLKEGANINKSLSALGNVINALVESSKGKKVFVPYRNSKLTRVLQESLGGNSLTSMMAAMSPASCNFEETLSTLKYANRAKAIKVNAVKNDEASQISRLNEEIRMLRERLATANSGTPLPSVAASISVDTSVMEEKHRQQLKELEEAMKSTWADKSKMSEEHEAERRRLESEQRAAAAQLQATRERNWNLLKEKKDLELSISHLKSLVKGNGRASLSRQLSNWSAMLKDITRLEQRLSEQETVVQVYKSALEKDCGLLVKDSGSLSPRHLHREMTSTGGAPNFHPSVPFDKASLSSWRQLKDKFLVMKNEISKWGAIQKEAQSAISTLMRDVQGSTDDLISSASEIGPSSSSSSSSSSEHPDDPESMSAEDLSELRRGLLLVQEQLQEKAKAQKLASSSSSKLKSSSDSSSSTFKSKNSLVDVDMMAQLIHSALDRYLRSIQEATSIVEESEAEYAISGPASPTTTASSASLLQLKNEILSKLNATSQFHSLPSTVSSETAPPNQPKVRPDCLVNWVGQGSKNSYFGPCSFASDSSASTQTKMKHTDIGIDGSKCWYFVPTSSTSGSEQPSHAGLSIVLEDVTLLSQITFQGGMAQLPVPTAPESIPSSSSSTSPSSSSTSTSYPSDLCQSTTLPSGLTLSSCSGQCEDTIKAVEAVMSWSDLLKKTSPDKFLKRPPVRFLFDLFKFLAASHAELKVFPEAILTSNWEEVNGTKQSKLDFMDLVIQSVSQGCSIPPITTAANIVTGAEAELTNSLLQQLSILIFARKGFLRSPPNNSSQSSSSQSPSSQPSISSTSSPRFQSLPSWPVSLKILFSKDGKSWGNEEHHTLSSLTSLTDTQSVQIRNKSNVKYLRIVPIQWASAPGDSSSASAVAMRLNITGQKVVSDSDSGVIGTGAVDAIGPKLDGLRESSVLVAEAIEFLGRVDERVKYKKQDEIKKHLEGLAHEKQALENLLASEKEAMVNEKQGLADQLKEAMSKLLEAQHLLEIERAHKNQLQDSLDQSETEKQTLHASLQEQIDENASLKNEFLQLQAHSERDKRMIESLENKVEEQDRIISSLSNKSEEESNRAAEWEEEKDDLQNQITVLTEERDTSRLKEEELYEQLTDKTADLEKLQESYVDLVDRCNDAQDEVGDLRDQIESLKTSFAQAVQVSRDIKEINMTLHHPSPNKQPTTEPLTSSTSVSLPPIDSRNHKPSSEKEKSSSVSWGKEKAPSPRGTASPPSSKVKEKDKEKEESTPSTLPLASSDSLKSVNYEELYDDEFEEEAE